MAWNDVVSKIIQDNIVTTVIALWGAVLSSWIFFKERFKTIKVSLGIGLIKYPVPFGTSKSVSDPILSVDANNHTNRIAVLEIPEIELSSKDKSILVNYKSNITFPYELKPYNRCVAWVDLKNFAKNMVEKGHSGTIRIRGVYRDALGKKYKGKYMDLDLDEWTQKKK